MSVEKRKAMANVILRSASGLSPTDNTSVEISPTNIKQLLPRKETIVKAIKQLEDLGFSVDEVFETHISIAGSVQKFEDVFGIQLNERYQSYFDHKEYYYESSGKPLIPTALSDLIETLEFLKPANFYSAQPPPLTYDHLEVPLDIARDMDAARVHSRGIFGEGIKIAMVDSGFMTPHHAYYLGKGYNIRPVIAAPSDPSPLSDPIGHGTGIAACVLSVAPMVTFMPVKMMNRADATNAFSRAVQQDPNIITCSWGFDNPEPAVVSLRMAISNAVANGVVVLFACGNRKASPPGVPGTAAGAPIAWPSSEPVVISVGGAFLGSDDTIQASNFTASGTNVNNSGRQCPDLCGLCGLLPWGIYVALPTQPGSQYDVALAGLIFGPDGTTSNDGWCVFSGTSSATPMVAGVVALLMQADPRRFLGNPSAVLDMLQRSCTDVISGSSCSGENASLGPDLATGHGLVQAYPTIYESDIWIKDNLDSDIGLVPTHGRRPIYPPFNHWTSADIRVWSAPLANPNTEFETASQTEPIFSQNNYVYVRIRNRGRQPSGPITARLYYADPSTYLRFPADWKDGQSGNPGEGTIHVSGVPTNLQSFPNLIGFNEVVLPEAFVWQPPDPSIATQTQILPDGRVTGHFCLLMRLESAGDPILIPGGSQSSVIGDNNIGMKNVHVYSAAFGKVYAINFFVRGGANNEDKTRCDLLFDLSKVPEATSVEIQMNHVSISRAILDNAIPKDNFIKLTLSKQKTAKISGIALEAHEKILTKILVKLPDDVAYGEYHIPIGQIVEGRVVGGLTFVARVIKRE
jgi:subtilisin family serine protease